MSRLSILIPWRESSTAFENTLVSVLENRPENSQVIVVHRGEYDDPYELRREVLLVEHDTDATLCDLLNRGLEVASGDVLHLLSCGAEVAEGWAEHPRQLFADDLKLGSVTPLVVDASRPDRLVNAGVVARAVRGRQVVGRGRRANRPVQHAWGPSLRGGFYRLSALRDVGGFDDRLGELVDVDIAASLRGAGYKTMVDAESTISVDVNVAPVDPELPRQEVVAQAERLFWRHAAQSGWAAKLLHTTAAISGGAMDLATGRWSCVASRVAAVCELGARRDYRRQLAVAAGRCGQDPVLLSLEDERRRRGGSSRRRKAA